MARLLPACYHSHARHMTKAYATEGVELGKTPDTGSPI